MAMPALPVHETEVIEFSDWCTVDEAAAILGKTGQRVRQMIANNNFATIAELGDRPFYLLVTAEVEQLRDWIEEQAAERLARKEAAHN